MQVDLSKKYRHSGQHYQPGKKRIEMKLNVTEKLHFEYIFIIQRNKIEIAP